MTSINTSWKFLVIFNLLLALNLLLVSYSELHCNTTTLCVPISVELAGLMTAAHMCQRHGHINEHNYILFFHKCNHNQATLYWHKVDQPFTNLHIERLTGNSNITNVKELWFVSTGIRNPNFQVAERAPYPLDHGSGWFLLVLRSTDKVVVSHSFRPSLVKPATLVSSCSLSLCEVFCTMILKTFLLRLALSRDPKYFYFIKLTNSFRTTFMCFFNIESIITAFELVE